MPVARGTPGFSSVWGEARDSLSRHDFRGGNLFMLRMLNRYRGELGVRALSQELDSAATHTEMHLATDAAGVRADSARLEGAQLHFAVAVHSLGGHKLPTAHPSRRAWLHMPVRDRDGQLVFESGAPSPDGSIAGNDNDFDGRRFEPHFRRIDASSQVQIYESEMADAAGIPTTSRFAVRRRSTLSSTEAGIAWTMASTWGARPLHSMSRSRFASSQSSFDGRATLPRSRARRRSASVATTRGWRGRRRRRWRRCGRW
jgi:hypothetical protein